MVDVQVLAGSKQGLRHLALMAELVERAHGNQVSTDWFYQNAGATTRDEARLTGDFESLQDRKWLWYERTSVGIDEVVLTQPGIDVVEEFLELRDSRPRRMMTSRDRVLHWLYESNLAGNSSPVIDHFLESEHANYYGSRFSDAELKHASNWLHDEELIAGTKSYGGPVPRPNITTKGMRVVESGASVNAQATVGGTTVNTNNIEINGSHSLNVVAGSSHVTQSNTVSIEQRTKTNEFIGSTRDLLPMIGLTSEQQALVGEIVDELETETTSAAPQQSKMKELANKALEIVVTGTASGMVNALVAMGNGVILGLG